MPSFYGSKCSPNGNPLSWVEKADHLGNTLSVKLNIGPISIETSCDLLQKRAIFFDKVHQLTQKYGYCDPRLVCELVRVYGTSFYGSVLWKLNSFECERLYRSWNIAIKMIFNLPFACHKQFVESLVDILHL